MSNLHQSDPGSAVAKRLSALCHRLPLPLRDDAFILAENHSNSLLILLERNTGEILRSRQFDRCYEPQPASVKSRTNSLATSAAPQRQCRNNPTKREATSSTGLTQKTNLANSSANLLLSETGSRKHLEQSFRLRKTAITSMSLTLVHGHIACSLCAS